MSSPDFLLECRSKHPEEHTHIGKPDYCQSQYCIVRVEWDDHEEMIREEGVEHHQSDVHQGKVVVRV